ncbi:MAG: CopD family protein [Gammaproteobacteria bacterium]
MELLLGLFGFLSVMLRCLCLVGAALVVGGVVFRHAIVLPVADRALGPTREVLGRLSRLLRGSAWLLAATALATLLLDTLVMMGSLGMAPLLALTAPASLAFAAIAGGALVIASDDGEAGWRAPAAALLILVGMICTTHSVSRLEHTALLVAASTLHQVGAYCWLGGLPYFLVVLNRATTADRARLALRYSHLCAASVVLLLISAGLKSVFYIGGLAAVYGSQYGAMSSMKLTLFATLLCFGAGNFLATRRLAAEAALVVRLRRFVEVEMLIGLTLMFVAGAMTSLPPAVDLGDNLAPWATVKERVFTPRVPRLTSPDPSQLAIPQEQARLDALAAEQNKRPLAAYVPGTGVGLPDTPADLAWSEYNHNWSGIFLLIIGVLALFAQAGWKPAQNWPLMFFVLGLFVLIRSDPESWPTGDINFFAAMRAPEVVQHRLAVVVTFIFAVFEWRVRKGRLAGTRAEYVFPAMNVAGGILLLAHTHDLNNPQEALLMEWSHLFAGLFALSAGCARWLEIRATGFTQRVAGWVWPWSFVGMGLVMMFYRES